MFSRYGLFCIAGRSGVLVSPLLNLVYNVPYLSHTIWGFGRSLYDGLGLVFEGFSDYGESPLYGGGENCIMVSNRSNGIQGMEEEG